MRILLLALSFRPAGGLEIYSNLLARTIQELGNDVDIWSVLENKSSADPRLPATRYCAPHNRLLASLHFRSRDLWLMRELVKHRDDYDLVIAAHPMLLNGTFLASRMGGGFRYWTCTYGSDVYSGWSRLRQKGFTHSEKILTVSEYTAGVLKKRLPDTSVRVVYPMVRLESEGHKPQNVVTDRRVLLSVSRINASDLYKGQDMVIRALPEVQKRLGCPVTYRVVGGGDGIPGLIRLAADCGVGQSVHFTGRMSDVSLQSEYAECDLFILPSRMEKGPKGHISGEGFGMVYVEAAAFGIPVIGSEDGGAPEAMIDGVTGIQVDPNSLTEIADAICSILSDQDLARRMGEAGKKFVHDHFSMSAFRETVGRLLEETG